jgi:peptidoglycan hydrolase CwlO-like protein
LFFKDQYEQQIKELRKQIKQINEEKQQEFENISKQINEINSLKQQIDETNQDKVRRRFSKKN